MLDITHTVTEGTLLDGTIRGDGSAEVIKPLGWRWSRTLSCWYLPRSRDRRAEQPRIENTRRALTGAGFTVTVTVDDTMPPIADLEQSRIERQQTRVDRLTERSGRATAAADAATQAAHRAVHQIPPGGEPIKVGHHSEKRHRRAFDRAETAINASIAADSKARAASDRLAAAAHTTSSRYAPQTVANRITALTAEIRATQRRLDGYTSGHGVYSLPIPAAAGAAREQLLEQLADQQEELRYWEQIRGDQIAAGTATNYSRTDIAAGDLVKISNRWRRVVRANKTTVSVETGYSWTERAPYSAIQDHRRPGSAATDEVVTE